MPTPKPKNSELETVEPIGNRVLIRKDEDKIQTQSPSPSKPPATTKTSKK